jgi:hypothetical protein
LPLSYFFTILRRSLVFWLGVRVGLMLVGALNSIPVDQVLWLGPAAVLFLILAVAGVATLDMRAAREHILLGNLGMAPWWPALTAAGVSLSIEVSIFLARQG